jgi:hypothetical protein
LKFNASAHADGVEQARGRPAQVLEIALLDVRSATLNNSIGVLNLNPFRRRADCARGVD